MYEGREGNYVGQNHMSRPMLAMLQVTLTMVPEHGRVWLSMVPDMVEYGSMVPDMVDYGKDYGRLLKKYIVSMIVH